MQSSSTIDWRGIDTVLLDMDGTLLDLRFDNWFWGSLIPTRYAAAHGLSEPAAHALLGTKFKDVAHTLQWYCIEYWTRELKLDIAGMKRDALARVEFLPGAENFLQKLKALGKRVVLVTNSHPETLAIKDEHVALTKYFDACYSSHPFEVPKENAAFWPRLAKREEFAPPRTLFIDDSLRVLESARNYGIAHLRAVRCPDSGAPPQATGSFVSINGVAELL
ncbi:MAG TPA: GMP/IMP nucleotidase [Steroidobacteraceae bacterium]|jgi:putative hydrolase of the HAD superfamily